MNYFANKEDNMKYAKEHTLYMANKYPEDIDLSVFNTIILSGEEDVAIPPIEISYPECEYVDSDTVSAILNSPGDTIWALNFASYKNPGGMFLYGSLAQEESLCRESFLYNVISHERFKDYYAWNRENLNLGLYTNRMLISPDIVFERGGFIRKANIITCAAPNYTHLLKKYAQEAANPLVASAMNLANFDRNVKVLESRIKFLLVNLRYRVKENDTVILGAFGCGVFKQDPTIVSQVFKDNLYILGKCHVIFAVPSGYSAKDHKTANVFRDMVDSYEKVRTYDT